MKKCNFLRCSNDIPLDKLQCGNHKINNDLNEEFNQLMASSSSINFSLCTGSKVNYLLHFGDLPSVLNFTVSNYFGKGNPGREIVTLIESIIYAKYLRPLKIELPFKHQTILDYLNANSNNVIHVIVYNKNLDDESAKINETICINMNFSNLINKQLTSIDISHLNENEINNLRTYNLQQIKNSINTSNHRTFNIVQLEQLIKDNPYMKLFETEEYSMTIESLGLHAFNLAQNIQSFTNEQEYIIYKMVQIERELAISFQNSAFRRMIKKCLDSDIHYYTIRYKLQLINDLTNEEINLKIENLKSNRVMIDLESKFNANLKLILEDILNRSVRTNRSIEQIYIMEYIHQVEEITLANIYNRLNLRNNENRFKLMNEALAQLEIEPTLSLGEYVNLNETKSKKRDKDRRIKMCEKVLGDQCNMIRELVDVIRNRMIDDSLLNLNDVHPGSKFKVGDELSSYYLMYLETTRRTLKMPTLKTNIFVTNRRFKILQDAARGLFDFGMNTKEFANKYRHVLYNKLDDSPCTTVEGFLLNRINHLKLFSRDQNQINTIISRIDRYYAEEIDYDANNIMRRGTENHTD